MRLNSPLVSGDSTVQPDREASTQEGFVSYVRSEFDRRLRERMMYEQQWMLNLAFLEGEQFAQVHRISGEIVTPEKKYPWEVRDVFNHLAPTYETRIAKLTRNRPMMTVRPSSPDEDDISAAKVSSKILQYNMNEQHFDGILGEAVAWSEATGTAFVKSIWNPGKGSVLPDPMGGPSGVPIGDVETIVVSPFEMFPETTLRPKLEDQRSLIHAKAWPLDSDHVKMLLDLFYKLNPDNPDWKPSAEDVASVTLGRGLASNGLPQQRYSVANLKNHILVLEYYERPCRDYPRGRFAVVIQNKMVHYGDLPYQLEPDFPFAKIDCLRRPNCFWSKSIVERLIPIQRRYNTVRNRTAEYMNRIGVGQWTAEEGTVDVDELSNEPGIVIEHTRGSRPPQPVMFPPLPSTFADEMASLGQEFMQISGVHEVSHGQMPAGGGSSPSGVMLAQLQEQDDTRVATTQRYIDEAVEKVGRQWLLRYKEFAVEQRQVPIMGKNSAIHIVNFDRNTIKSYNVKVEASTALAMTPAARREMVFSMLDRGLLLDPDTGRLTAQALQKIYELLEFGNWDDVDEDRGLPTNRANYENQLMANGQPVNVWQWEDHGMHVVAHQRYRQTEEFYTLLESPAGQQIAMLFEQHVQMHLVYIEGQMMQQAPPDEGGGGPPPEQAPPQ